jgi:metallo-beta-lactamase class B
MKYRVVFPLAAVALVMSAGFSLAQASWDTANIPQPHLEAAMKLALQESSYRHPGLVSCFWALGQASQNVNKNPGGAKIFDNLYYVGDGKYGIYAIDTSEGIILIDAMNTQSDVDNVIIPNMKNVGLDPARLKLFILSHGHPDHFGGAGYLVDKYHLPAYCTAADWDLIDKLVKDPKEMRNNRGLPPKRDRVVREGDTITLGEESIKVYITPGHSPGAMTMLIPVKDKGKPRLLAYFAGIANPMVGTPPGDYEGYEKSYARLEPILREAKVDGFICSHPNYDDAVFKIEVMRSNPPTLPHPFLVGTEQTILYTRISRECNLNNADVHRAKPDLKTNTFIPSGTPSPKP